MRGSPSRSEFIEKVVEEPMLNKHMTIEDYINSIHNDYTEDEVVHLTKVFCLNSTSDYVKRTGMEFLYMNGFFQELDFLLLQNKQSVNPINRKWANLYELLVLRKRGTKPQHELLDEVHQIKTNIAELNCLVGFMKIYLYYDLNEFEKLGDYLDHQSELINDIEDPFLTSLFFVRLNETLFTYYWKRNELILARKYAFQVLTYPYCQERKANIHMHLGLSYLYENYLQCIYHLEEAKRIATLYNKTTLIRAIEQQNFPFISAHFGVVDGITTTDPSEQAHLAIARGEMEEAKRILKRISLDSPFRKYYLGLAEQDKGMLLRSYNDFIVKRSDYFFSRLPLLAINDRRFQNDA
ncbi:AimR family lysis-lysogeny pheromone receptor [Virgibacillus senegalensis]|uniref:AimR family lysis-lysogeny pheromone receptor n=1 Tax=Virgibacillus senegalensis TaxID=1499679 RepID=UPI00069F5E6B|nr:AimR family lysis-lysogeny pheromone receptor [Virgibacillus senegalensis]